MMKSKFLTIIIALFLGHPTYGQKEKTWSIEAGMGGTRMLENRYDDGHNYVNEDQGNSYFVSMDYWLSNRVALMGGMTLEQQGLFTDYSDDIGLKTVNMFGLHAGGKYYFFPTKWIFQPYIGAAVYSNVINLGHQRGESNVTASQGHPGSRGILSYDVSCPALTLSPHIGFDLHLLSTLSLGLRYDLRYGLWGRSKSTLYFTDGAVAGQNYGIDERNHRSCISIALKLDFPVKPVSERAKNNLFMLLYSWIASK